YQLPTITITSTLPPSSAQVPKLYPDEVWMEPITEQILVLTRDRGVLELDGYHTESMPSPNYPEEALDYYRQQLTDRGWLEIFYAGGRGDEAYGYEKLGK